MYRLDEKNYRPPFITETDESRWNDCTICSALMLSAAATNGMTVLGPDWRPLNAKELKARREAIRNQIPGDKDVGGTSMADMRLAFKKYFGDEFPDMPFYDSQKNSWEKTVSLLKNNWVGLLQGNPINVKNEKSALRRWTKNDNYDHAIYADRARSNGGKDEIYIMDPLGRGDYDGQWVPASEVQQFIGKENGYVKSNMVERGSWTPDAIALDGARKRLSSRIEALELSVKELEARVKKGKADLDTANETIKKLKGSTDTALKAELEKTKNELSDLRVQYDNLDDQYKALTKKWDETGVALDNLVDVYGE